MIEPLDRNSIIKIESEEDDFVIVGGKADSVELDNTIDFTKKGCDLLMFASKHSRIPNFDERT